MKKKYLVFILSLFISTFLKAEQVQIQEPASEDYPLEVINKIQNDKEVLISFMDSYEISRVQRKFSSSAENEKIKKVFSNNLYTFLNNKDAHCESKYIQDIIHELGRLKIASTKEDILDVFKMLRINNSIDDIFYDIVSKLVTDYFAIMKINTKMSPAKNIFKNYNKIAEGYHINDLFLAFKKYPNESDSCSYSEYVKLRERVGGPRDSVASKNDEIKDLAYIAQKNNTISLETFNKIKFLSKDSTVQGRQVWLNDYFKIIFQAKNKMIPFKRNYKVINLSDENTFSSERLGRFSQLTRRKILYQKYDEGQIVLLSQVMKKASQRMGVDPDTKTSVPFLTQEFDILTESGTHENLVEKIELDTQDQFNLARRLLRKDMVALQMMKSFSKVTITYEDLVMASLETGYISLDDIAYVVKYDDLWNPETSKAERFMQMTFKLAGYGTFFLPPPWNVTGALTLAVIEGIVDSKTINGASNDNPNTFIE